MGFQQVVDEWAVTARWMVRDGLLLTLKEDHHRWVCFGENWTPMRAVYTDNLNAGVAVMKPAQDGA